MHAAKPPSTGPNTIAVLRRAIIRLSKKCILWRIWAMAAVPEPLLAVVPAAPRFRSAPQSFPNEVTNYSDFWHDAPRQGRFARAAWLVSSGGPRTAVAPTAGFG